MKQSRTMSLAEAALNVVVGYVLTIITQVLVFPWFSIKATPQEYLVIGLIFVIISLVRSYALRRLFDTIAVVGVTRHNSKDDSI